MEFFLSLIFGSIVGISLGLTGGGGAIFAVPMLVYGLGLPAKPSIAISLAAVGSTALVGFLSRWRAGQAELGTGLLFAIAGMCGAPIGTWVATKIPDTYLLLLFAGLMLVVAARMWHQSTRPSRPLATESNNTVPTETPAPSRAACQRDKEGRLKLNTRCAMQLLALGVFTGVLSGMFGVGGGFVIVPALVLFSQMPMHRAVGTSLMVVAMVSISGLVSQLVAGNTLSLPITGLFVLGGLAGLLVGQQIASRLKAKTLQKVFSVAIVIVAIFVILKILFPPASSS